jgi:hypothetical protein
VNATAAAEPSCSTVRKNELRFEEAIASATGGAAASFPRKLPPVADIEWVLLRSFTDRAQAQLLGEFLVKQGIQASVEGSFSAGVLPGVEGVRVMVPADRVEEARNAADAFDGSND